MIASLRSLFTRKPSYLELAAGDFLYNVQSLLRVRSSRSSRLAARIFAVPLIDGLAEAATALSHHLSLLNDRDTQMIDELREMGHQRRENRRQRRALRRQHANVELAMGLEHQIKVLALQLEILLAEARHRRDAAVAPVEDLDRESPAA